MSHESSSSGEEHRKYLRFALPAVVRCAPVSEDGRVSAEVREHRLADISMGGVEFVCDENCAEGTLLHIELQADNTTLPVLSTEALVVRCVPTAEGENAVGLRFTAPDEPTLVHLILYAHSLERERFPIPLALRAWNCTEEELEEWTFFREGKNCWETEHPPCGLRPMVDCFECPYAVLSFLA